VEHHIECLEEGLDLNGLEIEASHKKECDVRPMSKGKVQLTSCSCSSDLTLGSRVYKSIGVKLCRPRHLGEGASLEGVGFNLKGGPNNPRALVCSSLPQLRGPNLQRCNPGG
jgi:hypothetical protein